MNVTKVALPQKLVTGILLQAGSLLGEQLGGSVCCISIVLESGFTPGVTGPFGTEYEQRFRARIPNPSPHIPWLRSAL